MKVGINLAGISYWSNEFPLLDRVKSSALLNSDWSPTTTDPQGVPADSVYASGGHIMAPFDPLSVGICNNYVLRWKGTAKIGTIAGGTRVSEAAGEVVFTYGRTDTNQSYIDLYGLDKADPIHDISLVRADQRALYDGGEIFNPAFLDKMRALGCLRHMDWTNTNALKTVGWADRTLPGATTYMGSDSVSVPVEVQVALANETQTDPWLNVPTLADDDHVRQLATYVRDHLDPGLTLHLEYGNEVWNWGFFASHYALDQGDKLWGTDANKDGKVDPNDNAEHFSPGWVTWYGYRAAQVAAIARDVFKDTPARLRTVLGTQTAWLGLEGYIFDGVGRAGVGDISALFSEYAITGYFNGMLDGGNDVDKACIVGWSKAGEAGLAAAFEALRTGAGLTAKDAGSLAFSKTLMAYHADKARQHGLDLVIYEGGLDLTTGAINDLPDFRAALRADPRMTDIYLQMLADAAAAGVTLFNVYSDVSAGFQTLNSIYDATTPQWDALVKGAKLYATQAPVIAPPAPPPVTAPVTAPVATPAPIATTPAAPVVEAPAGPPIFAAVFGNTSTGQGGAAMVQGAFTTIGFDRVVVDSHGGFDLATGIYTVAEDGFYDLSLDNFRIADGNIDGLSYGVGVDLVGRDSPAFRWARGAPLRQSAGCFVGLKPLKKGDQLRAFYYLDGAPTTYIAARWSVRRIA